ncbi:MAG: barstar family protein [Hyphomonas sp.]|nr:barstar family protein [Hyphomonas sp.]
MTTEYIIEGFRIVSLETFFDEITRVVVPGSSWGHNLDAIDDILRGGFGTPDEGFILKWSHSRFSKEKLGYAETVR